MILPEKVGRLKAYGFEEPAAPVRMDANESFISLPWDIREGLAELATGIEYNRYPDPLATGACAAFGRYINISPRHITAGNGSDELISLIVNCFLNRGDKILFFRPDFAMYEFYSGLAELEICFLDKDEDLNVDLDAAGEYIKQNNIKLVIFSNPCSPTGQGLGREEILKLVSGTDALCVIDEAYMDFWNQSVADMAQNLPNLIVLRTCSKAVGIASLRLGFAIASEGNTDALRKVKSPVNVNVFTQVAAEYILSTLDFKENISRIIEGRDQLFDGLADMAVRYGFKAYSTVCNFVFVKIEGAVAIHRALQNMGVSVRRIGEEHLRITTGSPAENEAFFEAFEKILSERGEIL